MSRRAWKVFSLGAGVALTVGLAAVPAGAQAPSAVRARHGGDAVRQAQEQGVQRARSGRFDWGRIFGSGPTVVAKGLNNPRQLSFAGSDFVLLAAEAGKGGPDCIDSPEGPLCVGSTGSVNATILPQFANGAAPLRVVTGLPSGAGPDGSGATGPDGVTARDLGSIYVAETFAPPDAVPPAIGPLLGKLLKARPFGAAAPFADISGFEAAHDPDGQGFDSNPYAALALPGRVLVADAAANDILSVAPDGTVSLFAVLPNITDGACAGRPNENGTVGCDPVPTSLAVGPDGAIYVGGLAGEAPGAAKVWKLNPRTGKIMRSWGGFTTVTGVAVGRDGSIYVSELFGGTDPNTPGDLVRIAPNGARTAKAVPLPAGVVVDAFNNVFVSAFSLAPDTGLGIPGIDSSGQIWRLRF